MSRYCHPGTYALAPLRSYTPKQISIDLHVKTINIKQLHSVPDTAETPLTIYRVIDLVNSYLVV